MLALTEVLMGEMPRSTVRVSRGCSRAPMACVVWIVKGVVVLGAERSVCMSTTVHKHARGAQGTGLPVPKLARRLLSLSLTHTHRAHRHLVNPHILKPHDCSK